MFGLQFISIWNNLFYLANTKQDKGFYFNFLFKGIVKAFFFLKQGIWLLSQPDLTIKG